MTNLTGSTGAVTQSYSYNAFGNLIGASSQGTLPNPRQFLTKEADSTGLIYFGARYYDPRIGRFITTDPSGMSDGPNVYLYCRNNPVNLMDAWGLCVSLGQRTAFGPGNHLVIILQQSNDKVITIAGDRSGRPNLDSLYGNLISSRDNSADNPKNLRDIVQIKDPLGRSGKNLIRDILNSVSKYKNNLPYDPLVDAAEGYYNSNSYVAGILLDAGITSIPSLPGWRPGEDEPIPLN